MLQRSRFICFIAQKA